MEDFDRSVRSACDADAFCRLVIGQLVAQARLAARTGRGRYEIAAILAPEITSAARVAGLDDDLGDFEEWVCRQALGGGRPW